MGVLEKNVRFKDVFILVFEFFLSMLFFKMLDWSIYVY